MPDPCMIEEGAVNTFGLLGWLRVDGGLLGESAKILLVQGAGGLETGVSPSEKIPLLFPPKEKPTSAAAGNLMRLVSWLIQVWTSALMA